MNEINKEDIAYAEGLIKGYTNVTKMILNFHESEEIKKFPHTKSIQSVLNMIMSNLIEKAKIMRAELDSKITEDNV